MRVIKLLTDVDAGLVRHELPGDVRSDLDGLTGKPLCLCPSAPLEGAVVDQRRDPLTVLADERAPEEMPVCAQVPGPLVRQALPDAGQLDGLRPDRAHGELGPGGNVGVDGYIGLVLHDLLVLQELVHEVEGAVAHARQEEHLQERLRKVRATYRLGGQVGVEGLLRAEAAVDLLHQLLLVHLRVDGL